MPAHPEKYSPTLKALIAKRMEKQKTTEPKMATAMMGENEPPYILEGVTPPKAMQLVKIISQRK